MQEQVGKVLRITRYFNAPREIVWNAWKDKELYKKWWGPKNFTCPYASLDFRIGGKYLICMRDPDGTEIWGTGTYKEIDEHRRIVASDSFSDKEGKIVSASEYGMKGDFPLEMLVKFTFEEEKENRTKFTLEHYGLPVGEMIDLTRTGWNESFDKLEELLTGVTAEKAK